MRERTEPKTSSPRRPAATLLRRGLAATASLLAVAALSAPAAGAETARSADSFVDSIGVNTHTFYTNTVYYQRFEALKKRLRELGIHHVREELVPDRPDQYERLGELASSGIRSTLILGEPGGDASVDELLSIVRDELRGDVAAVEGANEFDMRGGSGWTGALRGHQARIYSQVKGDPALSSLPVIGPSIVHHSKKRELDDISGDLDYGNIHSYPDGYFPESNLTKHLEEAANNSGSKPVMATETGYHTALGWNGEHKPVSEDVMATYVPRMFLEYYRRGIERTFSYELVDLWPEPDERESNFGLLRHDLSPKPAFYALRNLIAILDDGDRGFSPGSLDFKLAGDREGVEHVLLQKGDGTFYLALWRDESVWNPVSRRSLQARSGAVTVNFNRQPENAEVYSPNDSASPVYSPSTEGGSISLELGPQVTILKLRTGDPVPERIKLWVSRRSVPAGGRVAVRGVVPTAGTARATPVAVQYWRGRERGGWQTVGRGRTSRNGVFRRLLKLQPARFGRVPRLRVVARSAQPSRIVRVRIRRHDQARASVSRIGISAGQAVEPTRTAERN